jgi:formylglycine-generating enzyme required for sulfatase activity
MSIPTPPRHLRVFLASPGDVAEERALAAQVLDNLVYDPLLARQVTIEIVAWDMPKPGVPMPANLTPQMAIERGLPRPSQCDIVIAIFWSRMGTPLPPQFRKADGSPYLSGTEWEYLDALAAAESTEKPAILVYRRTQTPSLALTDPDFEEKRRQWRLVEQFFATFRNSDGSIGRGWHEYSEPEDFRQLLDHHAKALIGPWLKGREVAASQAAGPAAPPLWEGSPFPGLRAFTPDDAPIFFGRGRETDGLVRMVADARFVTVVGASGSGKSSLVAAGLLPRLSSKAIEGSSDWLLPHVVPATGERKQWAGLRFTPGELGDDPFVALAARLAPLLPEESTPRTVAEHLEAEPEALAQLAGAALQGRERWAELVMFIDQFEELFTVAAERHRQPFIKLLVAAAHAPRMRTVATVRADFYPSCIESADLANLLRGVTFPLAMPSSSALDQMVGGPAARAGLDFEPGLRDRILEDTGSNPGALALLAFALHELYEARTPAGLLTNATYEAFGGVRGAISRRADSIFARLPKAAQDLLGDVFRELIEVKDGVATRRRVARETIVSSPQAEQLVDAFTAARLLVMDRGPDGRPVVEVAHEALLREWPRVAGWVREFTDDLCLRSQVESAAGEWQHAGRDPSHHWPHERLVPVYESLERLGIQPESLAEPTKSFVQPEAERLLAELDRPETSHYRRAEIGDRLDRIDDPRPGVGLLPNGLPDIVWCEIPGGTVTLEGVEGAPRSRRRAAKKSASGTFTVEPFLVAKYPITYRQYRAFLDDPQGYRHERWWKDLEHMQGPGEQYRPIGNCPADDVSWYDAVAYCRWLSARVGAEVRLPTEWEWQQAATGGRPDQVYPWGPDWDERCANTDESHLSRTTAVGMYPGGSSAQKAMDLAGNVWECCLNKHDPASDCDLGGDVPRVVRGGSWYYYRELARCAYRYHDHPDFRYYNFGFRVVRVSPIS